MSEIKSEDPLISIIIPCYNKGKVIFEAVDSVYANNYKNFEIIVVDDGSTEKTTQEALRQIAKNKKYQAKTKIHHKKNGGLSSARNYGISRANGKYQLFLDHDDLISKDYLTNGVDFLERHAEISFVYPDIIFFGDIVGLRRTADYSKRKFRLDNYIPCSCIHRSEIVQNNLFDEKLKLLEDWDFLIRLANQNLIGSKIDGDNYLYYRIIKKVSMIYGAKLSDRLKYVEQVRRKNGIELTVMERLRYYAGVAFYPFFAEKVVRREKAELLKLLMSDDKLAKELNESGIIYD